MIFFFYLLVFISSVFFKDSFGFKYVSPSEPAVIPAVDFSSQLSLNLTNKINQWRLDQHQAAYFTNEELCQFAQTRLLQVQPETLSHATFYQEAENVFPDSGFKSLGENLAGFSVLNQDNLSQVSKEIFQAWLTSPAHLQNLQANFSHSCLKCNQQICIQVFGRY